MKELKTEVLSVRLSKSEKSAIIAKAKELQMKPAILLIKLIFENIEK